MKYTTHKPVRGLQAEVNALRELSAVIERNPWMPRPMFQTSTAESLPSRIAVNVWSIPPQAEGETEIERMKDYVRAIRRAFGGGTWKKNNPRDDSYAEQYYTLTREWHGATLQITTHREQMCQLVVREEEYTEEVPDPDVVAEVPTVTVTKTRQIREWICNDNSPEGSTPMGVNLKVSH